MGSDIQQQRAVRRATPQPSCNPSTSPGIRGLLRNTVTASLAMLEQKGNLLRSSRGAEGFICSLKTNTKYWVSLGALTHCSQLPFEAAVCTGATQHFAAGTF